MIRIKRKIITGLTTVALLIAQFPMCAEESEYINFYPDAEVFEATAYCGFEGCSESWGTMTATGVTAKEGRTIAVDPKVIPLGSTVMIWCDDEPLGIFQAEDTGGAIKGNIIDIYFDNHSSCTNFGRRKIVIKVVDAVG